MNKVIKILNSIRPEANFQESQNYIEDGLLDSFDLIALVSGIDNEFGISVLGTDIVPSNFINVNAIEALIETYKDN